MLPITEGAYDVDIGNDGTFEMTNQTGTITIDFGTGNAGEHTIAIRPSTINTNNQLRINHKARDRTPQKLMSIDKWGDIVWTSMHSAFKNCSNMTIAVDAGMPDLTWVYTRGNNRGMGISMRFMFKGATNFNADLSQWDVSKVTDMSRAFEEASIFNSKLNDWDVSNATSMNNTFREATSFNGDISSWDVSNATSMNNTFREATSFNGDISSWNVSNC